MVSNFPLCLYTDQHNDIIVPGSNMPGQRGLKLLSTHNFTKYILAAYTQRFDHDPDSIFQDYPPYPDPFASTYRSSQGWDFNITKVRRDSQKRSGKFGEIFRSQEY